MRPPRFFLSFDVNDISVPGLAGIDGTARQILLANARLVRLEKNQFVFHAGDMCQSFLVLLDGQVRVQLVADSGREVTLYRIESGGSCVLTTTCLLSNEHYPAEAIAESDSEAVAIPVADFQSALDTSQAFRDFVFAGFSTRLTNVIRKIEQITFASIDSRLAAALIACSDDGIQQITHQDLAVELGTAREVVSRHLKNFEACGWLRLGRGRIEVIDRAALQALAGDELM